MSYSSSGASSSITRSPSVQFTSMIVKRNPALAVILLSVLVGLGIIVSASISS